jgi:hypothetical protein
MDLHKVDSQQINWRSVSNKQKQKLEQVFAWQIALEINIININSISLYLSQFFMNIHQF